MARPLLQTEALTVGYYRGIDVVQDVSISVQEGRVTALLGPNGAGKSTLLKALFGLLHPRRGRIIFDGDDITRHKPHERLARGMAMIPQMRGVFPHMTVQENLELGAWPFRRDGGRVQQAIEAAYRRFPRLRERSQVKAGRLSGGEQKMLEIARAMMTKPRLILMDEPTEGLSPKYAAEIYGEIKRLREDGFTIILADQNIRKAVELCDYVYVLELGRVKAEGERGDIEGRLREVIMPWL